MEKCIVSINEYFILESDWKFMWDGEWCFDDFFILFEFEL